MTKKAEIEKLNHAIEKVSEHLDGMYSLAEDEFGNKNAAIFEAQKMLLNDVGLYGLIYKRIEEGQSAAVAVREASEEYSKKLLSSNDEAIRSKSADIKDISKRLINVITGKLDGTKEYVISSDGVINGDDLTPSDILLLDKSKVRKVVFSTTSIYAHTVIIAKSRGFEVCMEKGNVASELEIDAASDLLSEFKKLSTKPFMRTEYLFMNRDAAPDKREQYDAYLKYIEDGGYIIRIFDLGGDKTVQYLETLNSPSDNPALAFRGIRFALSQAELLKGQVRAIVNVARKMPCMVLLPMVTSTAEVLFFKEQFLKSEVLDYSEKHKCDAKAIFNNIKLGVMIETPAAALIADELARVSDLMMIGVNDLLQYTYAVDRQSNDLSKVYSYNRESIKRLVKIVLDGAKAENVPVFICEK